MEKAKKIGSWLQININSFFKRFKNFRHTWKTVILNILPLMISFPSLVSYLEKNWWAYVAMVAVYFLILIFKEAEDRKVDEQLKSLKDQNERYVMKIEELESNNSSQKNGIDTLNQALESLPQDFIKLFFNYLGLNGSERVSVYIYDESNFKMVARHSPTHEYSLSGRISYPKDQGYISKCWHEPEGYFYVDSLPDPEGSNTKFDRYAKRVKRESNLDAETLKSLSMKSRAYYVKLIKEKEEDTPIGVIVIESVKDKFPITEDDLNKKLSGVLIIHLHQLISMNNIYNGGDYDESKN